MDVSQDSVGASNRRPMLWGGVATVLLALGIAGCATPTGSAPLAGFFPGSEEKPKPVETVEDFVGLERPG